MSIHTHICILVYIRDNVVYAYWRTVRQIEIGVIFTPWNGTVRTHAYMFVRLIKTIFINTRTPISHTVRQVRKPYVTPYIYVYIHITHTVIIIIIRFYWIRFPPRRCHGPSSTALNTRHTSRITHTRRRCAYLHTLHDRCDGTDKREN